MSVRNRSGRFAGTSSWPSDCPPDMTPTDMPESASPSPAALLYARSVSVMNRRNAILGWATWTVFRQLMKRNAKASRPNRSRRRKTPFRPPATKRSSLRRRSGRLPALALLSATAVGLGGLDARPGPEARTCSVVRAARRATPAPSEAHARAATRSSATSTGHWAPSRRCSARRSRRAASSRPTTRTTRSSCSTSSTPATPRPFRRSRAARSSPRSRAATSEPGRRAARDVPDARPRAREHRPLLRPGPRRLFTTMERGHYLVTENGGGPGFAEAVVERLEPLATSHLVIDNEFRPDLEPELWDGDELTREIGEVGRRLDALGLLPAPFPVEDCSRRARPAAHQAAVRDRRPLVRQPLGAQGRRPLLDERERRRQGEARRAGPRHPARLGLRRRRTGGWCSACRPTSSRGASRSTRSSTG